MGKLQLFLDNSKMRICNLCNRELSTPFNLRRHMKLCHNIKSPPRVGKTKTIERWGDSNSSQTGGGSNVDDDDDEESIADSEQSTKTDDSDTNDEEGAQANDDDDDDDENWVFKRFFDELAISIDGFEALSLEQRQKLFREYYAEFLIWNYHLRRNPVYKKIMETIQDLEDGMGDFDKDEAIQAGVVKRQFLLNRIVEAHTVVDEDDDDDKETESDVV